MHLAWVIQKTKEKIVKNSPYFHYFGDQSELLVHKNNIYVKFIFNLYLYKQIYRST